MLQHVAHMFITDWETLETVALQQLFDQTGTKMSTVGELLLKLPTTTSVKMKKGRNSRVLTVRYHSVAQQDAAV